MLFPNFSPNRNHEFDNIQSPPFLTLKKLRAKKSKSILKYCYKLISKALSLSNLERQNVYLVRQIFNEYTTQGLLTLEKEKCSSNFAELAKYINVSYI